MHKYYLCFTLLSDAAFSRGDGLAGEVDSEIQYDNLGCPFLSGRALKGILVNECADLLAALKQDQRKLWENSACRLFGQPGQLLSEESITRISDACLPEDLRLALRADLEARLAQIADQSVQMAEQEKFQSEILQCLTSIRSQTAMDEDGVAKEHSLRSRRVILRTTPFEAEVIYAGENQEQESFDMALLAACTASFRRVGSSRTRGLGKLSAWLENQDHQRAINLINPFIEGVK